MRREVVPAMVVSAEDVANNPTFALLREREGIPEPRTNRGVCIQWSLWVFKFSLQITHAYRRTSVATQRRKASNCRSDSSIDSTQNNSSVHKKKSKKGKHQVIYINININGLEVVIYTLV